VPAADSQLRAVADAGLATASATSIAHDLQTPVAVILGLCARIEAAGVSDEQAADLHRLRAQAGAVSRAAGALMAVERPAAPERRPVDVGAIAREVSDELAVLAHVRGAIVVVSAQEPAWVLAARDEIESVLSNLLSNAVRQLDGGGCVRCSVRRDRGRVEIEVADSGPGVPETQRLALLDDYTQGTGARGRAGLGLGIVRATARRLGGSIAVGDAPEGGAAFTLSLPEARLASRRRRKRRARRSA
jgi:signal transduction histidine kinase